MSLEHEFIIMMTRRGWEHQSRSEKKTNEVWVFQNTVKAYEGQTPQKEALSCDSCLHFRKSGHSIIVNLARERVVNYDGYPSLGAVAIEAECMNLNAFYGRIDEICGTMGEPKKPVVVDAAKVWETLKMAALG